MHNKRENNESSKRVVVGINHDLMAQGYEFMKDINFGIANEMYHLETESTYTVEKLITGKGES